MLSYQQLKTLIKIFFRKYNDYYYRGIYNVKLDKSAYIHPAYRFNLFSEFSNKPVKFNRNDIPDSAADNFCVSLFDE